LNMIWITTSFNCGYPLMHAHIPLILWVSISYIVFVGTHDAIHDTFVAIMWNVSFHMWWKQLNAFPSTAFNSSCQWVDKKMHGMVVHFCDEMMFFLWIPFIQMHMVINISLYFLIGTWIETNDFIMKWIVWLIIDKKIIC
jgi:hypothetical protein